MSWFSNPVLLEWDQSIPWCDLTGEREYEALRKLMRGVALRTVPAGAVLFALGFWLIGRIPGGSGPLPLGLQLAIAGAMLLIWVALYAALELGVARPKGGTSVRVRLTARGVQLVHPRGRVRFAAWSRFDAFDFVGSNGFELLRLRLRDNWLSRRLGPQRVATLELGASGVQASSIRETLRHRGLQEEPLGELG